jgi:hypothetical protein
VRDQASVQRVPCITYACTKPKLVKLSLCLTKNHGMKMYGRGGITPRIRNLGTRWRLLVIFTLQSLCCPEKNPR